MRRPFIINLAIDCALAYASTISILHAITYFDIQSIISAVLIPIVFILSLFLTYVEMRLYEK